MKEEQSQKGRPILRDSDVKKIIAVKKYIPESTKEPFKMSLKNGHYRANIDLVCPQYKLSMRVRKTEDDERDFSVLMIFTDAKGHEYILRRYNGDHGKHTDPITRNVIFGPHIHMITEECQRTRHKDEGCAEATKEYQTLRQAINVFMQDMNIEYEKNKHSAKLTQFGV